MNHVTAFSASYSQWKAASGTSPSVAADSAAKAMALAARDALMKALTPDGVSKLVLYVQAEKAHMVVRP
jgi:hypothetical protein